jgi:hypothetical protein
VDNPSHCKVNPDLFARLTKDLQTIGNVILDGFSLQEHFNKTGTTDELTLSIKASYLGLGLPPHLILEAATLPTSAFNLNLPEATGVLYIEKLQKYGRDGLDWIEAANKRANELKLIDVQLRDHIHRLPKRPTECAKCPSQGTHGDNPREPLFLI